MSRTAEFLQGFDRTHDSFFLPSFFAPGLLGRIVFQSHPLVLFRAEALEDERAVETAAPLLCDVYTEFLTQPRSLRPGEENRVLRALAGYAFWKGEYDWIYTLAFYLQTVRPHDSLSFLASMLALREGRSALASYFKNAIRRRTEWMDVLERGLLKPYDELGGINSSLPFFNPGARRRGRQVLEFAHLRIARDAALAWFLSAGAARSLHTAARRWPWILARWNDHGLHMEEDSEQTVDTPYARIHSEGAAGFRPGLRLSLASSAMKRGDFEQADAWLNGLLNRHPRILHLRASCHRQLGALGLAAQEYRRIVKRYPGQKVFVENYARILLDLGRTEEARKAMDHAEVLGSKAR